MREKMKAIVKTKASFGAELTEVNVPEIGKNQVLIKVKAASICGTDFHIYHWNEWASKNINPPQIMGHEVAGKVVKVGSEVNRVKVGEFVSAETHVPCGECYQCQTGKRHICKDMKILGVHTDGVFAEYAVIESVDLWKNDDTIPPDYGSVQEPLGNAIDTIRAGNVPGKTILITGAGPIGLLAVGVARAFGATKIIVSEPNSYRRELARKMGADITVDPTREDLIKLVKEETKGTGVDFTAEMSGHPAALDQGLKAVTPGGSIALLGIPETDITLDLSSDIIFKGIKLIGITGREMFRTWHIASRLIKEKRINLENVITHRLPMEDFVQGMELMKSGECGKIILIP